MALSEREQKVLDQLEELMHAEDPQFASSMSSTGNTATVFSARNMVLGILCVRAGLGIIIGAASTKINLCGTESFRGAAGGEKLETTNKKTSNDLLVGG